MLNLVKYNAIGLCIQSLIFRICLLRLKMNIGINNWLHIVTNYNSSIFLVVTSL